jgi:hypothetical protein
MVLFRQVGHVGHTWDLIWEKLLSDAGRLIPYSRIVVSSPIFDGQIPILHQGFHFLSILSGLCARENECCLDVYQDR